MLHSLKAAACAALIAVAIPQLAAAQNVGPLPAWNLVGNKSASVAPARAVTLGEMLDGGLSCATTGAVPKRSGAANWACSTISTMLAAGTGVSLSGTSTVNVSLSAIAARTMLGNAGASSTAPVATALPTAGYNIRYYDINACTGGNDTTAFLAAQAAAKAAGGFIYLPTGVCRVDPDVIKLDWTGAGIRGNGPKNTVLLFRSCGTTGIEIGKAGTIPEETFVDDLQIGYEPGYCASGRAFFIDYNAGTYIYNVKVEQAYQGVVMGNGSTPQTAQRVTIHRSNFSTVCEGILATSPAGTFVRNTNFSGHAISPPTDWSTCSGVKIIGSADGLWLDAETVVQTYNIGVEIAPSSGNATEIHIGASIAFTNTAGVRMQPSGSGSILSAFVEGATIFIGNGAGIVIADGLTSGTITDISIDDTRCKALPQQCVVVNAVVDGIKIRGLQAFLGGSGSFDCIDFNNRGANNVLIDNNLCAGSWRYGLNNFAATTNVLLGPANHFFGSDVAPTANLGTASSTRILGGGTGNVAGAASSTDNAVARFDSTTGKVLQNSGVIVDDSNNVTGVNSLNKVTITQPASGSTLTIANGKTATVSNTLTFTGTDGSSVAFGGGGTAAYTGNNLGAFAATSSSQLAGVISDETGSGAAVFGTSPTLGTPTLSSPTIAGTADVQSILRLTGAVTSSQITANQNNYTGTDGSNTCATKRVLRISSDAARDITGLSCSQAAGDILVLYNVGSFAITLKAENASSTAANRFGFSADRALSGGDGVTLIYDGVASRYRLIGSNPGAAGGGGDVVGPASSTDNALPRFDGAGGKTLQASSVIVDDSNNVTGVATLNKVTITQPASGSTLTIANGKTATVSNTLTFTGTDGSSVAFGAGGTAAYTGNNLGAFAATTSSQLAGVISDETGSGAAVFANSPALTGTPTAPTQSPSDNSTRIATTAYVDAQVAAGVSGVASINGATGALTLLTKPTGRLSLVSGDPVPITDQTAKTTIYLTGHNGASVQVYDGSNAKILTFLSELSFALDSNSGHSQFAASGNTYDVFVAVVSGTTYFGHGPAWSNDTTRGASLARSTVHGLKVNSASMTLRYGNLSGDTVTVPAGQATWLGTFRATANGQTEDSLTKRFLANAYNAVPREMKSAVTSNVTTVDTSFVARSSSLRLDWVSVSANGSTKISQAMVGSVNAAGGRMDNYLRTDGSTIQEGVGAGTSANANDIFGFANEFSVTFADGFHYVESLQKVNTGGGTIWGGSLGGLRSSISGFVIN